MNEPGPQESGVHWNSFLAIDQHFSTHHSQIYIVAMALIKDRTCSKCGKKFFWKIERPSDGNWDRWKSDDGNTLSNWFITHNLCREHAFAEMPEQFKKIIRTEIYEEQPVEQKTP